MKKIALLISLMLFCLNLMAAPIGEKRAREIATNFFAQHTTRSTGDINLTLEWAGNSFTQPQRTSIDADQALLYIYNNLNRGFVVIAGDDALNPIIAYSFENNLLTDNMAEATEAILDAWCRQVAASRRASYSATRADEGIGSVVTQYQTAIWNQTAPFNNLSPVIDGERSVTGCVATAISILCYYHKWPLNGVGAAPAYSYEHNGVTYSMEGVTLGHSYDYANMLDSYNDSYTTTQGNAVARLMYDLGVASKMMYHPTGSGAFDIDALYALGTYFGYNKDAQYVKADRYTTREWVELLKDNLDSYGPTYFSGSSQEGGHAFVVDGYTTNDYFSFNFGWGGYGNGYFLVPTIEYYANQGAFIGLYPDTGNTTAYEDYLELYPFYNSSYDTTWLGLVCNATKYESQGSYGILIGGIANSNVLPFNGTIYVVHCNEAGEVKRTMLQGSITGLESMSYTYYTGYNNITLDTLEAGDRIRLYYTGEYSTTMKWARSYNQYAIDEIIVCGTVEDVAKCLNLKFTHTSRELSITAPMAIQYAITDMEGNPMCSDELAGGSTATIDTSEWAKGSYQLSVAASGEAYTVKIKL